MEGWKVKAAKWQGRNKGKRLYKCVECGIGKFMRSYMFNLKHGDRCMNCGGQLEAKSEGASIEARVKRTAYNRLQEQNPSHICFTRPRKGLIVCR
jgi:DNA-directed RNA polymerase subunit RPC12/RpoP